VDNYNLGRIADFEHNVEGVALPAWLVAGLVIAVLTVGGIAVHHSLYGSANITFCLISLFLSINLLICYWEICLFLRKDYIEKRHQYWKQKQAAGGSPAMEFINAKVSSKNFLSPTFWADVWAAYSIYDGSYADRRTYGFNADVGNGFVTLIPSLILHAGITVKFLPANVLGILGVMMFWQWLYCTTIYWVSFFMAGRHKLISRTDMNVYVWGTNAPWAVFSVLGLYVSIRLILDNSYAVFGI